MCMMNLPPLLSLQVHCYPECVEELRPRYKSTAAERRTRTRHWELFHCSIVYTVVMPHLYYSNATLAGITFQHRQLQSVLNAAAQLIHRSSRHEHVTPLVRELHWLWSRERIDFKLAVLIHRCLYSLASRYLSNYFHRVASYNRRCLRSSSSSSLLIRRTQLITVGDCVFPVAGSYLLEKSAARSHISSNSRCFLEWTHNLPVLSFVQADAYTPFSCLAVM